MKYNIIGIEVCNLSNVIKAGTSNTDDQTQEDDEANKDSEKKTKESSNQVHVMIYFSKINLGTLIPLHTIYTKYTYTPKFCNRLMINIMWPNQ